MVGGGVALVLLDSLPEREGVTVHRLPTHFARASTWLMWRKGMLGANLKGWIGLLAAQSGERAVE